MFPYLSSIYTKVTDIYKLWPAGGTTEKGDRQTQSASSSSLSVRVSQYPVVTIIVIFKNEIWILCY